MKFEWVGHVDKECLLYIGEVVAGYVEFQQGLWRWRDDFSLPEGKCQTIDEAISACEASVKASIKKLAEDLE